MTEQFVWPWIGILGLGAFHGINPGMGWLFAVALGMQERSRRAVWWALVPLTLGHALAMAVVVALAIMLGVALPDGSLKWPVAAALAALGLFRLYRHQHLRGGGMRVGTAGLTGWSFLMASCHGAGLMVLPFLIQVTAASAHAGHHHHGMASGPDPMAGVAVTLVHMAGYLAVTAIVAVIVFERFGVYFLRRLWFNLDMVWAVALLGTAALTAWS
jgi:hypothetical protein